MIHLLLHLPTHTRQSSHKNLNASNFAAVFLDLSCFSLYLQRSLRLPHFGRSFVPLCQTLRMNNYYLGGLPEFIWRMLIADCRTHFGKTLSRLCSRYRVSVSDRSQREDVQLILTQNSGRSSLLTVITAKTVDIFNISTDVKRGSWCRALRRLHSYGGIATVHQSTW